MGTPHRGVNHPHFYYQCREYHTYNDSAKAMFTIGFDLRNVFTF
jgi:hypothetical protein